jgi:spectrin beta
VEQSLQQLQSQLTTLKDHASIRRLRLLDAVESQMFYSEAIEAETWIREKRQQLSNPDVGKDEDSIIVSSALLFKSRFMCSCVTFFH